jgi:hypothetical protein
MTIIIESGRDLSEAENIVMMADFCQRHFNHEHARNAIAAVRRAIKEYKEREAPLFAAND